MLPLLYLHGLSSGDFVPALEQFLGSAAGLSAAAITRLTAQWTDDYRAWCQRDLSQVDYVYVWADGIHVNVRLEEDKLCLLVIVGVRADGSKELVALADGYRESAGSWADLLRDCARRGMRAPMLAVGDGALGFWAALREVFPDTREQRDWVHKSANVLAALPKSAHPGAKAALAEIWGGEDKRHALAAAKRFADLYGAKFGKAVAKVTDDLDVLLTFYDFPAEHWVHLRHLEPDRVDVRHRAASHPRDQGTGQPRRWPGDGVQAHRGRPGSVAGGQRTRSRRPRSQRRHVRRRSTRRTTHRSSRRIAIPVHKPDTAVAQIAVGFRAMRRAWVVDRQMRPGAVLFEWDRPFSLWGYSGSHSQLLFRSVKYDSDMDTDLYPEGTDADGDPPADKWPRTRIDLLFKPVDALCLRQLSYPTLRVQVATERITEEILDNRMHRPRDDWQVLELVGPDGVGDHIVCLATGYCEDDGEYWEPSPFAADLSDGHTPPWRRRVLGGGPDGELSARYVSVQELVTAIRADLPPRPTGDKGRWLYVVMTNFQHTSEEENRPNAVAAFLTRHEAEHRVRDLHDRRIGNRAVPAKYWVDAVPIDL